VLSLLGHRLTAVQDQHTRKGKNAEAGVKEEIRYTKYKWERNN
jgi:hypothetical protein